MLIKLFIFILFIFIIEFSQFYFKKGIMDINDVITNTLGYIWGFYTLYIYNAVKRKLLEKKSKEYNF